MKVARVAGLTGLLVAGCTAGGATSPPSSSSVAPRQATATRETTSPGPAPSGVPVVRAGDVLVASRSSVGPGSIEVPRLARGTRSLVLALTCETGSFALRSKGGSPFQGECAPGLVNAVRAPLDLLDVHHLTWQVSPGVAWHSWVWSSATER